jgi:hypothetical protein
MVGSSSSLREKGQNRFGRFWFPCTQESVPFATLTSFGNLCGLKGHESIAQALAGISLGYIFILQLP